MNTRTVPFIAIFFAITLRTDALTKITNDTYHGWPVAYLLNNGKVEAVIVPAIGRVMQFKFAGDADGPFWENRELDGKAPNPNSTEWGNFGGDKSWPSPQADWGKVTRRGWPPPKAFDSMPVTATIEKESVILTSAIDPNYGIRARRIVSLLPDTAKMQIVTEYEKVEGAPVHAGVWIVTQLKDPQQVQIPLPKKSEFPKRYVEQSEALPQGFKVDKNTITCARSPKFSSKIGTDASELIWMNDKWKVVIESPRIPRKSYPDNGSSAEVYTNPDPLQYVELEMLGPLADFKKGDRLSQTNTYTLSKP
jgi:hypothetical protein